MTIEWFEQLYESDTKDLLWLKDFMKQNPNVDTTSHVHEVHVGLKGMLIITGDWKGFIFKGSQPYNHLLEALQHWIQTIDPCPELVAGGTSGGKVRLGVDPSKPVFYWEQIDESYYQKSNGGDVSTQMPPKSNPLLDSTPIPTNGTNHTGSKQPNRATKKS